ncbi:MAG: dTMP kinase [Brevinematales bacterium]|nr:dTMP kinase [Brevinematales bacterium]
MEKGFFIVFEGIEGSGKTTQSILLSEKLKHKDYDVIHTKEPGGTDFGEKVRNILLHEDDISDITELLLFLADRKEHIERLIKPSLEKNKIVISDRYFYSTLAYQIGGRKLDENIVKNLNNLVVGDMLPDIVFYIDIDIEESIKRKKHSKLDRIEREEIFFHINIRNEYLKIAQENENFKVIDGKQPIQDVHHIICNYLRENFGFDI